MYLIFSVPRFLYLYTFLWLLLPVHLGLCSKTSSSDKTFQISHPKEPLKHPFYAPLTCLSLSEIALSIYKISLGLSMPSTRMFALRGLGQLVHHCTHSLYLYLALGGHSIKSGWMHNWMALLLCSENLSFPRGTVSWFPQDILSIS